MAAKKHLGVFFDANSLSLVEVENVALSKYTTVSYTSSQKETSDRTMPDEIKITALLQKALRELKFTTTDAFLSLPTKDVIFRSFVIPFMSQHEISGVVELESRKYIPFKLSELSYTFQAVPFTENKMKSIRILFAAIKNEILETYCGILEHAGLKIAAIEPGALSLIRCLAQAKLISKEKNFAIIQADEREGKIIISNQNTPQFIRDFPLSLPTNTPGEKIDQDMWSAKFVSEVKISLDYYSRQSSQDSPHTIIAIDPQGQTAAWMTKLETEFTLPVVKTSGDAVLKTKANLNNNLLYAYGVALKANFPLSANFDIPRKSTKPPPKTTQTQVTKVNVGSLLKLVPICALVIVGTYFITNKPVIESQNKLTDVLTKQGEFGSMLVTAIDQKTTDLTTKMDAYKNVRLKTDVSFLLKSIPQVMPQGTWINNLQVTYVDPQPTTEIPKPETKISVTINGYAFHENAAQQIRLVNNFVENLRTNKEIVDVFNNIALGSVKTEEIDSFNVTSFRIDLLH